MGQPPGSGQGGGTGVSVGKGKAAVATIRAGRSDCGTEVLKAVGKDLIAYDIVSKVADVASNVIDKLANLPSDPSLGALNNASSDSIGWPQYGIEAADTAAEFVAGNRAAQQFIRGTARSQGIKVSTKYVGKFARVGGKFLGVASALLTGKTALDAYSQCVK